MNLKSSINSHELQIIVSRFEIKGDLYMKATGIVRRIEACVIIGQTAQNPHKQWAFR